MPRIYPKVIVVEILELMSDFESMSLDKFVSYVLTDASKISEFTVKVDIKHTFGNTRADLFIQKEDDVISLASKSIESGKSRVFNKIGQELLEKCTKGW